MMYFKQFYLGCLAHASYLIGSNGEALVVDPQRDVEQYIAECDAQNLTLKYIVETHLHRDFVSGHCELAARTGAKIVYSHLANVEFPHLAVKDGDEIQVGTVALRVVETPGHTPESISLLVFDRSESEEPLKVLTGDTMFVGDVGRPDLAGAQGYTPQSAAALLYDSLHKRLLTLNDSVEVYPAHGAGSLCGRNMSKESSSTIGEQRRTNYALRPMPKNEFVDLITKEQPEVPLYFPRDAEINRQGAIALADIKSPRPLSVGEVKDLLETDSKAILLDVRTAEEFGASHINGSINIGLGGQFAMWAGALVPHERKIIIVAGDDGKVAEAVMRLARIGLENVVGYLEGGVEAWRDAGESVASVPQISVGELQQAIEHDEDLQIVDVRRTREYLDGHVAKAHSAPLAQLSEHLENLDQNKATAVICAGGYRSSAALGILAAHGFKNLRNVTGGTGAFVNAGYAVTQD